MLIAIYPTIPQTKPDPYTIVSLTVPNPLNTAALHSIPTPVREPAHQSLGLPKSPSPTPRAGRLSLSRLVSRPNEHLECRLLAPEHQHFQRPPFPANPGLVAATKAHAGCVSISAWSPYWRLGCGYRHVRALPWIMCADCLCFSHVKREGNLCSAKPYCMGIYATLLLGAKRVSSESLSHRCPSCDPSMHPSIASQSASQFLHRSWVTDRRRGVPTPTCHQKQTDSWVPSRINARPEACIRDALTFARASKQALQSSPFLSKNVALEREKKMAINTGTCRFGNAFPRYYT